MAVQYAMQLVWQSSKPGGEGGGGEGGGGEGSGGGEGCVHVMYDIQTGQRKSGSKGMPWSTWLSST